jgi:hypothetical protein
VEQVARQRLTRLQHVPSPFDGWLPVTPLIVHSRLLELTIRRGSAVHIIARSTENGEQVEVLEGEGEGDLVARKNYPSPYPEPDQLTSGQMTMVNQTIDLGGSPSKSLRLPFRWPTVFPSI